MNIEESGKNERKKLALFDLDGTLTLPRKVASKEILDYLSCCRESICLGIVSGSDLPKINEQLGANALQLFDYIFPENGIIAYRANQLIATHSIAVFLGEENLKKLINFLLSYLAKLDLPIKRGTFIEYRTGMLNVSPIGRNCSYDERIKFESFDKQNFIRKKLIDELHKKFSDLNLHFSIGGQISIDIFPKGWDKSFCLQFLENQFDEIHFFGDKTDAGGNDYEIYEDKATIGHKVVSPEDTIKQLRQIFNIH